MEPRAMAAFASPGRSAAAAPATKLYLSSVERGRATLPDLRMLNVVYANNATFRVLSRISRAKCSRLSDRDSSLRTLDPDAILFIRCAKQRWPFAKQRKPRRFSCFLKIGSRWIRSARAKVTSIRQLQIKGFDALVERSFELFHPMKKTFLIVPALFCLAVSGFGQKTAPRNFDNF